MDYCLYMDIRMCPLVYIEFVCMSQSIYWHRGMSFSYIEMVLFFHPNMEIWIFLLVHI